MAVINYTANAPTVAQVDALTPAGTIAIGNTFTVTMNGKSVVYTATATTVASVTAGLYAALAACLFPEFLEVTWADGTTLVSATAKVAGRPHTITVSKAQAGGATNTHTFTKTNTTANSGPSDVSIVTNYSGGVLPSNGDTLNLDGLTTGGLIYNADAITATGLTVNITNWRAPFGLPEYNPSGYDEYRATYTNLFASTVNYRGACSLAKINLGDPGAPCAFKVEAESSQSSQAGLEALLIKGGTATNHIDLQATRGSVGVAVLPDETAFIGLFSCGYQTSQTTDAKVRFGTGVTFQDNAYTVFGGQVESNSSVATITMYPNSTVTVNAGAIGTLVTNRGGTFAYNSTSTPVVKYIGYENSKLDLQKRTSAIVFTTIELYAKAEIVGGEGLLTATNPIKLLGCGLTDVKLPKDRNITVALAAI